MVCILTYGVLSSLIFPVHSNDLCFTTRESVSQYAENVPEFHALMVREYVNSIFCQLSKDLNNPDQSGLSFTAFKSSECILTRFTYSTI